MAFHRTGKRSYADEDAPHLNGKQRKRINHDGDSDPDDMTEFRILCPVAKVGSLIGKGGANISAIRRECKSQISVEDLVPGADERVVYIASSSKKDASIESVCPAQEALLCVHARIIAEGEDEDEPPEVTARLLVPQDQIGYIIGKGGKNIEQMRRDIPIQIRVMPKDQLPACASGTDDMVQLSGDPILVEKALKAVSTRLYENPSRERYQRGLEVLQGQPALSAGAGLFSGVYMPEGGSLLGPTSVSRGPLLGIGGSPATSLGSYPAPGIIGGKPVVSAIGSDGTEEVLMFRILCPIEKAGGVIGKGGSVIEKIRKDSQAKIHVEEIIEDCDERVIVIKSTEVMESLTSPGIEAALLVLQCLMDLQTEKERDNAFTIRLVIPSSDVGCLLGKGGQIISEMRKATGASIKIPKKEELPACADESVDDIVQITGDKYVVHDALLQVLNRLRANIFKGHSSVVHPISRMSYAGSNPISLSMGERPGFMPTGISYPLTNVGRPFEYVNSGGPLSVASVKRTRGREWLM